MSSSASMPGWPTSAAPWSPTPALALEIVRCQRLVKGYGDTHERGLASYQRLRKAWTGRPLPAAALAELRSAALADEHGHALTATLQRLGIA